MEPQERNIDRVFRALDTFEGGGVLLKRGFANTEAFRFDPFLLFDDFSSDVPEHYLAGFPWHPHRGMETITYILDGAVRHRDSMGNEGVITSGGLQRMSAGNGILHEEMPESVHGIRGFQMWRNLPRSAKAARPQYQDLQESIPEVALGPTASARVIAGELADAVGPLVSSAGPMRLFDIQIAAHGSATVAVGAEETAFAYVAEGAVGVGDTPATRYPENTILLFARSGTLITLSAGNVPARVIVAAALPLNEPIAWHGPIVMNTDDELRTAFRELQEGTFVHDAPEGE